MVASTSTVSDQAGSLTDERVLPSISEFARPARWLLEGDGTVEDLLAWVALHQRQGHAPPDGTGLSGLLDELRTVLELCVCEEISESQCRQTVGRLAEHTA